MGNFLDMSSLMAASAVAVIAVFWVISRVMPSLNVSLVVASLVVAPLSAYLVHQYVPGVAEAFAENNRLRRERVARAHSRTLELYRKNGE